MTKSRSGARAASCSASPTSVHNGFSTNVGTPIARARAAAPRCACSPASRRRGRRRLPDLELGDDGRGTPVTRACEPRLGAYGHADLAAEHRRSRRMCTPHRRSRSAQRPNRLDTTHAAGSRGRFARHDLRVIPDTWSSTRSCSVRRFFALVLYARGFRSLRGRGRPDRPGLECASSSPEASRPAFSRSSPRSTHSPRTRSCRPTCCSTCCSATSHHCSSCSGSAARSPSSSCRRRSCSRWRG